MIGVEIEIQIFDNISTVSPNYHQHNFFIGIPTLSLQVIAYQGLSTQSKHSYCTGCLTNMFSSRHYLRHATTAFYHWKKNVTPSRRKQTSVVRVHTALSSVHIIVNPTPNKMNLHKHSTRNLRQSHLTALQ